MHRYRAPSIAPGTFFVAQSWADFIINMSESNLRQAQVRRTTGPNGPKLQTGLELVRGAETPADFLPVFIISTHTTLVLPGGVNQVDVKIDDDRSEPLRHALVQKTDFQFELSPQRARTSFSDHRFFNLTTLSAIGQPVPQSPILWDRERMILVSSRMLV